MTTNIGEWEDDGGSIAPDREEGHLIGTLNQIALAGEIRARISAESDRVQAAPEAAAYKRSQRRSDVGMMIATLEEKRAQEMSHRQAGHYIQRWSELRHQVRNLLLRDPRYRELKRRHA